MADVYRAIPTEEDLIEDDRIKMARKRAKRRSMKNSKSTTVNKHLHGGITKPHLNQFFETVIIKEPRNL